MGALLRDLLGATADGLGALLGGDLEPDAGPLVERLWRSRLLDRPALMELLLARADEQRIGAALRGRFGGQQVGTVTQFVADQSEAIASAAMALVVERGRRRDRFGRARIDLSDLMPRESLALIELVAAGISARFGAFDPQIDQRLGEAIQALHGDVMRQVSLESRVAALVTALAGAGRMDDALLERAAGEGEILLLSAMLAERAHVPPSESWALLVDGGGGRLMVLLRLAGVARATAARLAAELDGLVGIASPVEEMVRFDHLSEAEAAQWRQWLATSAGYREARLTLESMA